MPVLPGEHIVVVYVVLAEVVAVVLLLLKQDFEQSNRIVCQGKAAEAGCVLRLVLLHDLRDPCYGVPYGQRLHRKVDAVPFQPQYLAAAQTVQRGDVDDGVGATKVLTADEQPSSATVNNSEESNNTFDFPYAHQNRSNSIGSIAYENGKADISGVLCNELAGQKNKKTAVYHQPDTTNRPKATAKTDGEFTTVNTNVARQDG